MNQKQNPIKEDTHHMIDTLKMIININKLEKNHLNKKVMN